MLHHVFVSRAQLLYSYCCFNSGTSATSNSKWRVWGCIWSALSSGILVLDGFLAVQSLFIKVMFYVKDKSFLCFPRVL